MNRVRHFQIVLAMFLGCVVASPAALKAAPDDAGNHHQVSGASQAGILAAHRAKSTQWAELSGKVQGYSTDAPVFIAVFDSAGFGPKNPYQMIVLQPQELKKRGGQFSFTIPHGTYTIAAFEDENFNGYLDVGWFGPKEPWAFSMPYTKFRAPLFSDVSFEVMQPKMTVTLPLDD